MLTPIATFHSYKLGGERLATPVLGISVHIGGKGGAWTVFVAILLDAEIFGPPVYHGPLVPSGRYYREQLPRTYRTKALAINAARDLLCDHFHTVPAETRLRIGRSKQLAFPC